MITGVVFCAGSAIQVAAMGNSGAMFAGRVIGGLVRSPFQLQFNMTTNETQGVGAASMLVPLYISEIAPPSIRGRLVGIYEMGVQGGTMTGFWVNYGVSIHVSPTSAQWRIPFAIQLIPGILLVIGMFFLPESPR